MREPRDYDDVPGTYVMDGQHSRRGYHLNMFCMSLNAFEVQEPWSETDLFRLSYKLASDRWYIDG